MVPSKGPKRAPQATVGIVPGTNKTVAIIYNNMYTKTAKNPLSSTNNLTPSEPTLPKSKITQNNIIVNKKIR
jgi:hypothetical protein